MGKVAIFPWPSPWSASGKDEEGLGSVRERRLITSMFLPGQVNLRRVRLPQWMQLAALGLVAFTFFTPALAAADQPKPLAALEGILHSTAPKAPVLETHGKDQPLSAITKYLYDTLQDKRLDGREVRVEGTRKPDGTFDVQWLYTIHHGKLFRVRYFCKVCNIVALGPGHCVCCQRPTELQEIPVEESGK
jgi:hypothetical protein